VPRLTVLLIGMDSGVVRNTALTDTLIVGPRPAGDSPAVGAAVPATGDDAPGSGEATNRATTNRPGRAGSVDGLPADPDTPSHASADPSAHSTADPAPNGQPDTCAISRSRSDRDTRATL
jgi:hypothetical protein